MKPLSDELKADVRKLAAGMIALSERAREEAGANTNADAQAISLMISAEFQSEIAHLLQAME